MGADFHTYFVGCDEWGFSVWAHNECVVINQVGNNTWFVVRDAAGNKLFEGGAEDAIKFALNGQHTVTTINAGPVGSAQRLRMREAVEAHRQARLGPTARELDFALGDLGGREVHDIVGTRNAEKLERILAQYGSSAPDDAVAVIREAIRLQRSYSDLLNMIGGHHFAHGVGRLGN